MQLDRCAEAAISSFEALISSEAAAVLLGCGAYAVYGDKDLVEGIAHRLASLSTHVDLSSRSGHRLGGGFHS